MSSNVQAALMAALVSLEREMQVPVADDSPWFDIDIPLPEEPFYRNNAIATLEIWADDLVNPLARRNISESDWREIAGILSKIAASERLRKEFFPPEMGTSRGRPQRYSRRDFLLALDYWLLRELHESKKGWEHSDLKHTAERYEEFGVTEHMVGHARESWRDECKKFIKELLEKQDSDFALLMKSEKLEYLRNRARIKFELGMHEWTEQR